MTVDKLSEFLALLKEQKRTEVRVAGSFENTTLYLIRDQGVLKLDPRLNAQFFDIARRVEREVTYHYDVKD